MPDRSLRLVVPRFGAGVVGGSESLMRRIGAALSRRGWRIEVLATTAADEATWEGDLPREERVDGYLVRRFPVRAARHPAAFHQLSRAFFRLPPVARPESLWLRAQGPYSPDLVTALARAEDTPTLFTPYLFYPILYGLPAAPHPRLLVPAAHDERPFHLAAVARLFTAVDALLYGTPEEQALVERVHPAARGKPSAVGTVGIDIRSGDGARFRRRFGIDGPILFYGGRAARGKGIDAMLAGFERLRAQRPEVSLAVAGADPADLRGASGVVAVGRLDDDGWADALDAAFAVIVPSPMESLSLLALETWAAGRPALVNAASPVLVAQLERSGGGLPFAGAGQLAEAAETLLQHPAAAERMGATARAYVEENYRWDDVAARLSALIATASA